MIEELKALAEKATRGPWYEPDPDGCLHVKLASPWREGAWDGDGEAKANAALIVTLVNNLPAIISALEAVPVMKEALEQYGKHKRGCSIFPRGKRTLPQCSCGLSQALAALEGK